jgi:hypothetical protein
MSMGRRLIERMSSLIIDKECLECLIELVEYKIKQKLTPEQRRMLMKRKNIVESKAKKSKNLKTSKKSSGRPKKKNPNASDYSENENSSDDENDIDENLNEDSEEDLRHNDINDDDEDDDDNLTKTTETSTREDSENDRELLKHIDDDGEKGLKLINVRNLKLEIRIFSFNFFISNRQSCLFIKTMALRIQLHIRNFFCLLIQEKIIL